MPASAADDVLQRIARKAGLLYLAFFVASILSDLLGHLTFGDAAAIVAGATEHAMRFRLAFVFGLLSAFLFLLTAWALHALLKCVDERLALSFLVLNIAGVAVQSVATLSLAALWPLSSGVGSLGAFNPDQLRAQAVLFAGLFKDGFVAAQLFYGSWLLPLGYLVYASGFLPRVLGVLLMADCIGILVWFFQYFLLPGWEVIVYPCWVVGFIAEASLTGWLVIRGVKPIDVGAHPAAPVRAAAV